MALSMASPRDSLGAHWRWRIRGSSLRLGDTSGFDEAVARIFSTDVEYIAERPNEARATCADIAKIHQELAWEPGIALQEGIQLLKDS